MTRQQLTELGYIVPIATVPSILQHGILSHNRAAKLQHEDISLKQVNDYRATVIVPAPGGGRKLHDYANLYICPRNPMLLKKTDMHEQLCVLRVNANAIDIPGAIVTDANAGSKYTKNFKPAPGGLSLVNYERTFADWWAHPDNRIEFFRHSAEKCAEVLVPNVVLRRHLRRRVRLQRDSEDEPGSCRRRSSGGHQQAPVFQMSTPMVKVLIGDIFKSDAQTLINTVNLVGVMGKGIALGFKKHFPEM